MLESIFASSVGKYIVQVLYYVHTSLVCSFWDISVVLSHRFSPYSNLEFFKNSKLL